MLELKLTRQNNLFLYPEYWKFFVKLLTSSHLKYIQSETETLADKLEQERELIKP